MGAAIKEHEFPQRCYNGQNHWKLGWFSDRTIEVDPRVPGTYKIAAFVDYDKAREDEYVVIKVSSFDLYLQYNRAKEFNRDSNQFADMVTIVRETTYGTELLTGLNSSSASYAETKGSQILTIDVCEEANGSDILPDLITVSIGYGSSLCDVSVPSAAPGPSPSHRTPSPTIPKSDGEQPTGSVNKPFVSPSNLVFIILGCAVAGVVFAAILLCWMSRQHPSKGLKDGATCCWMRHSAKVGDASRQRTNHKKAKANAQTITQSKTDDAICRDVGCTIPHVVCSPLSAFADP